MTTNKFFLSLLAMSAMSLPAAAHSVVFEENFNNGNTIPYSENFTSFDLDHLSPTAKMRSLFLDGSGVARPWWHLRDSSTSSDQFLCSHASYSPAGTSNDWLCSRAISIPTEGYNLTFDAQSANVFSNKGLSDLWLFITEEPVTEDNLPTVPTMVFREVPEGAIPDELEGDFTNYKVNLDAYAGKTIYINFANLNTDKEILALDNILVQRLDIAAMTFSAPRYVLAGDYEVAATVKATNESGLTGGFTIFLKEDGKTVDSFTCEESLAFGGSVDVSLKSKVGKDATINYSVELEIPGEKPILGEGAISGLAFFPWHTVLVEEATGAWCGNCPMGTYIMESMTADEEMKEYVAPVSIHVNGSGPDMMVNENYAYMFGVTAAPAFRFERSKQVAYTNLSHDATFDPSDPVSIAGSVKARHEQVTLLGMDLSASFTDSGRGKIDCKVEITPALSMNTSKYGIGIILTENNVGLDNSPFWMQANYVSGLPYESEFGGWTQLPEYVFNARWHDVAREIWGYRGIENSMPENLTCEQPYTFNYTIEIPDTYKEMENQGTTIVQSPAVNPDYLAVVAYIINSETGEVVNADYFPMTELTEQKFTTRDLVNLTVGVDQIGEVNGADAAPLYFDLQGRQVENPSAGIYIVRRGGNVSKEVIR